MAGGCVTGPIPKEMIYIPIAEGPLLTFPAGGFTDKLYYTQEELDDPLKFLEKTKLIYEYWKKHKPASGCPPGEVCG